MQTSQRADSAIQAPLLTRVDLHRHFSLEHHWQLAREAQILHPHILNVFFWDFQAFQLWGLWEFYGLTCLRQANWGNSFEV